MKISVQRKGGYVSVSVMDDQLFDKLKELGFEVVNDTIFLHTMFYNGYLKEYPCNYVHIKREK